MERLISGVGLLVMVGSCWVLCPNKKDIRWRTVLMGIGLQAILGFFIMKTQIGQNFFQTIGNGVTALLGYTAKGSEFIFGPLIDPAKTQGFIFMTMVLPTIIFMGAFMSVLYHLGIMQKIVSFTAFIMMKTMKTSGSESLSAAANIFVGQTEAPLVIRPYIETMTKSEILALMTGGMATIAGGVLAAYIGLGINAGHLLAASVMSAPAALVCAKLLLPETEHSHTAGAIDIVLPKTASNVIDAAAVGASDGLKLAANVAAMLLAFIALIAMLNGILGYFGGWFGFQGLSFEFIMSYLFSPVAFIMGVPWADCLAVGSLLGKKLVLNEFVAYLDLAKMIGVNSERSIVISTYALCGFSNFSSIAIQIGGIGTLAPSRRADLVSLGLRSLYAGTIACLMTACIAGIFN